MYTHPVCCTPHQLPFCTRSVNVTAFLWVFLQYEAKSRISAEAALRHPYFKSLGERVHLLPDSECVLPSARGTWSKAAVRPGGCGWQPEGGGLQPGLFGCRLPLLAQRSRALLQQGGVGSLGAARTEMFWGRVT